jgi:hypothetical protein
MVKPKWNLELCGNVSIHSRHHITLDYMDTKLWPISGCNTMSLVSTLDPEGQNQQKEKRKKTLSTKYQRRKNMKP